MQVNIKDIIKNKAPKLYKKLPRFVIWFAKRLLCEKQINEILAKCGDKRGVEFVTAVFDDALHIRREVVGLENIADGRYIFAANHPLGGVDGMALLEVIDGRFSGVKAIVNDILLNLEPIKELFLPVNKHGKQSVEYVNMINEHMNSDAPLLTFPAGFCSRKIGGVVKDVQWNRNYINKALEHQRGIVPVYVDEVNSKLFYNIEVLRKKLGMKLNLGMLLLPRELVLRGKKRGRVRLIFGEPISYEQLRDEHSVDYWNKEIRRRCYAYGKGE